MTLKFASYSVIILKVALEKGVGVNDQLIIELPLKTSREHGRTVNKIQIAADGNRFKSNSR